jgi:glycosyltransferase involved in cell wall biosynthesis
LSNKIKHIHTPDLPATPQVSVLVGTRNRPKELQRCLKSILQQQGVEFEVLVLDDCSDSVWHSEVLGHFGDAPIALFRSETSLGVAGGRNFLMSKARGTYLCILDDDAVFIGADNLVCIVDTFIAQPEVAIIAGKIFDHKEGKTRILAPFPKQYKRPESELMQRAGLVSYFQGGLHAIRKEMIDRIGGYSSYLYFGEEELDLSYRVLDDGHKILFQPTLVADHYPAPPVIATTRVNNELSFHVSNRLIIAYQYLPLRFCCIYLSIWMGRYLLRAAVSRRLDSFFQGIRVAQANHPHITRQVLKPTTLAYLRNNYGRTWY